MTQPDKSSEVQRNPHSDEIWSSDPSNLDQLWNLFAIPPLPGYAPAAMLFEPFEVHIAIETLRNWMRTQRFT